MAKPRIFLGSSGQQERLLTSLSRGLADVAEVVPWTTSFNPGVSTLERLLELTHDVEFAAFVFAHDDWTSQTPADAPRTNPQASPRDNVVFEAGLFGGVLGMRRTFILHAEGAKLPTDLLGLTCVRYDPSTMAAGMRTINQTLRRAIEAEGRASAIEGHWWQHSLTARSEHEPSAVSLLRISRERDGSLRVDGRAWQEDGLLSARYSSEATKEHKDSPGIFYYFTGERPRHVNAPRFEGVGEIRIESDSRGSGYFTSRSSGESPLEARTSGIYLRADPADVEVLDVGDAEHRVELLAQRLHEWRSLANS